MGDSAKYRSEESHRCNPTNQLLTGSRIRPSVIVDLVDWARLTAWTARGRPCVVIWKEKQRAMVDKVVRACRDTIRAGT